MDDILTFHQQKETGMADIKKGDEVQLKSGGPIMTVSDLGDWAPTGPENGAMCVWFDDKKNACEKVFDIAVLRKHAS
jgi:uncharacterized protein YodC (DUF2158 family)